MAPDTPLEAFVTWDYGVSDFGMSTACEWKNDYKLCTVDTLSSRIFEQNGATINVYIKEEKKGVCFPPSCSDEQIDILDPNPGQCDPTKMNCEIANYDVNCPKDRVYSNTGRCNQDKLASTSPFFITRGIKEASIVADCLNMFIGQETTGLCTASMSKLDISLRTDFTGFETDVTYINYSNSCEDNGGQICFFDMETRLTVPGNDIQYAAKNTFNVELTSAEDMTIRNQFIRFPRCIATACKEDDMAELLALHFTRYALLPYTGTTCDLSSANCEIKIASIQCGSSNTSPSSTGSSNVNAPPPRPETSPSPTGSAQVNAAPPRSELLDTFVSTGTSRGSHIYQNPKNLLSSMLATITCTMVLLFSQGKSFLFPF